PVGESPWEFESPRPHLRSTAVRRAKLRLQSGRRGTGVSVTRRSPKPQREVRLLGPPLGSRRRIAIATRSPPARPPAPQVQVPTRGCITSKEVLLVCELFIGMRRYAAV